MARQDERPFDDKQVDQWLKEGHKPEDVKALLRQITRAVVERALQGELTEQLGYEKHDPAGQNSGNSRNGVTRKKLKGDFGEIELETPRDRNGEFEPVLVKKNQTRFTGFDDKVLSLYARGMSTREIQGHLEEMYGVEVSPTLISNITEVWSSRQRLGRIALWSRSMRWCFSMLYLSRCGTKGGLKTVLCTLRSGSIWKAAKTCLACGPAPMKERSSGLVCSWSCVIAE